jgi:peptidoglycan/xylan/chitin deacetylase (PgdA/CDA1 family)
MKRKKKIKYKNIFILIILILIIKLCFFNNTEKVMKDLSNMNITQIKQYSKNNNLKLTIKYSYNDKIKKNIIIKQNIKPNTKLLKNQSLIINISKGPIPTDLYKKNNVNELGLVPIMMYHGIHNITDNIYTGGNIDKDGYNRTVEAFKQDLDMYYKEGYQMIKLKDYINGIIDVDLGKSPIILTFDDGLSNNIKILGRNKDNSLIIDPSSAVGILESYKKKYPNFNVTATFFINNELFNQTKYNNDILKWLVNNGYDIGNHTKDHPKIADITKEKTIEEVGSIYKLLDTIIPNKYTHIVALPYGSPTTKDHPNFSSILDGNYNDYKYHTDSTLRVGWDANVSPFNINFDKTYLKRVRAWDNNGINFDIAMVFNNLKKTKYISDGNINTITIPNSYSDKLNSSVNKQIIKY